MNDADITFFIIGLSICLIGMGLSNAGQIADRKREKKE